MALQRCKDCYTPSTNVSIDEMMVKCEGRSPHTLKMPNKPIDRGYKLYALCDHGWYIYHWIYYSRVHGTATESNPGPIPASRRLTATSQICLHLALSLPYQKNRYNIYFDNYFTNVQLFATLCEYDIGACGTAKANVMPKALRIDKASARKDLIWNDLFGVIEDGVLCGLWQDNNQVNIMSSIHDLRTGTAKLRRCPKGKAPHTAISRAAFGKSTKKMLTIPDLIDDYNHNMNGVDLADQLRASYNTHRQGYRTWLPLFYWLIDTLKVNAFLLWRMHYPKALHKTFQLTLHQQLVAEGLKEHEE